MIVVGSWRRAASHDGVTRGFMEIDYRVGGLRKTGDQVRSSFGRCPHLRIEIWGTRLVSVLYRSESYDSVAEFRHFFSARCKCYRAVPSLFALE